MNPTQNSLVELRHAVCGQKQNSFKVFEITEENSDKAIVSIMVRGALFHERVCFIQEEDCIAMLCDLKYTFEGGIEL